MGRSTQGVTLIALDAGEKLAGLETVVDSDDEAGSGGAAVEGPGPEGAAPEGAPADGPAGGPAGGDTPSA
jgi:DNA gyrase subunit A